MGSDLHDTICAIATPSGEGGIGVVRISGEKALAVASVVVRLRSGRPLVDARTHRLHHADLVYGTAGPRPLHGVSQVRSQDQGGVLDEALVAVMRGPRSYTGETVVELQCHGGPLVLQLLCEALVGAGARLAEPGEFTKRAFLNGRLDLTQAEGVLDTIRAKTDGGLRIAQEQLRGALSVEINSMREELIRMLAHVEASIDFTEEDITFIDSGELADRLKATVDALDRLIASCREGRVFREGVAAAIAGLPNVGKSSLLNALLRTDRAIVTSVPGTTRDVLEETLNIRGIPVRLLDTAGIHQTDDHVEREGVERSRAAMAQAELLIVVLDGSAPLCVPAQEVLQQHPEKPRLVVLNKCDLAQRISKVELEGFLKVPAPLGIASISALTGEGLDELRDLVREMLLRPGYEPGECATVTRLRHVAALERAREAVTNTLQSVDKGLSGEFTAIDMRVAVDALGEITGAVSTEDILDRVFSEFCIGK